MVRPGYPAVSLPEGLASDRTDNLGRGGGRRIGGEQLGHTFGELCSVAGPVLYALTLQIDGGRIGPWVIGAHHLDRPAIAGTVLLNYNNTIIRLLPCTEASQTNHQHRRKSFQIFFPDGVKSGWVWANGEREKIHPL